MNGSRALCAGRSEPPLPVMTKREAASFRLTHIRAQSLGFPSRTRIVQLARKLPEKPFTLHDDAASHPP
jgi:hypothetical protein